jgi:voltage-gated potassium channel
MAEREQQLGIERESLLEQIEEMLETPMVVLGVVWLALLVVDLVWGLRPLLAGFMTLIWGIFVFDFLLRFWLAPRKLVFLRRNWLAAISLALPAFRAFRVIQAIRVARAGVRGARLISIVGSTSRGMGALQRSMRRHGFGYVVALTGLVTLVGGAGMYAFEGALVVHGGLASYGEALWWTAMIMTTLGSQYAPQTVEGRLLTLLLAVYAFAVFGYFTAALASYLVGRDAENPEAELAGAQEIAALRADIAALRAELNSVNRLDERQETGNNHLPGVPSQPSKASYT